MRIVILQGDFKSDNDNKPSDQAGGGNQAQVLPLHHRGAGKEIRADDQVSYFFPGPDGFLDKQLRKLGEDILREPIPPKLLEPLKRLTVPQEGKI